MCESGEHAPWRARWKAGGEEKERARNEGTKVGGGRENGRMGWVGEITIAHDAVAKYLYIYI